MPTVTREQILDALRNIVDLCSWYPCIQRALS
jgi:hypothetical protein